MNAVADASPLCYLVLIGETDLLPKLFLKMAVPQAVIAELLHEDARRRFELGRHLGRLRPDVDDLRGMAVQA